MPTILFLCVANSARSQMAEGLARHLAPSDAGWRFYSAGSEPGTLNPLAVAVLREVGVDIAHHAAKPISAVPLAEIDTIVTLCAEEVCPVVPGVVRRLHWPLQDPAKVAGSPEERRAAFRAVRDELRHRVPDLWRGGPAHRPQR